MNNFYLLSFSGGSGGDFLATQIMNDQSFYATDNSSIDVLNTYSVNNILEPFNVDLKQSLIVDNQTRDLISTDPFLQNKKILLRTHFGTYLSQINLPITKGIRATVKRDSKLIPFYYTLLWIKRYAKLEHDNMYFFEKLASDRKLKNSLDLVNSMYMSYRLNYFPKSEGWIFYDNLDNLYLDPKNNTAEFSKLFDLIEPINPVIIENYFNTNVKLIETIFNKSLNNYLNGDWVYDLTEYVKKTCPKNSWCHELDSNQ